MSIQDLFGLKGRMALITGASGHLGKAFSLALAQAGAHVLLCGRNKPKLDVMARKFKQSGYSATALCLDITKEREVKKAISLIQSTFGRLDILVNNAYSGSASTFDRASASDFVKSYDVSVIASFRLMQMATPLLSVKAKKYRGGSSIINIASMYGVVSPDPSIYGATGLNNPPFYGTAKAGLLQLTKYTACHLAKRHIRVNAVSPGSFPSPEIIKKFPSFHKKLCAKSPMGRVGEAGELAGTVLYLASQASSFVTGANIVVDGGWTSW